MVVAGAIALLVAIGLYHYLGSEYLGAEETEFWNNIRRTVLVPTHNLVVDNTEYWGTVKGADKEMFVRSSPMTSDELSLRLEEHGYAQTVLAGLFYRPPDANPRRETVRYEDGSMVYRESKSDLLPDVFAFRQVHVYWFDEGEYVDVYAHEEYNSLNPLVAWLHYIGRDENVEKGKTFVRKQLE